MYWRAGSGSFVAMARRLRKDLGGVIYHVINRGVGKRSLFFDEGDFAAFEKVLGQGCERVPMRILAYCLMSNHFHLILWPRKDGELRRFMQWLTVTHTRRWHAHHHKVGQGALYQGRYKSFPVQRGLHLLKVARYVERNPLRAGLVSQAQKWEYCSLNRRAKPDRPAWLASLLEWPVSQTPRDWVERVNEPETEMELEAMRRCVNRGQPYGEMKWQAAMAKALSLESSFRDPWRPKKKAKEGDGNRRK